MTDLTPVRALVRGAGWSVPGEMRLFANAELEDAKARPSAGLSENR